MAVHKSTSLEPLIKKLKGYGSKINNAASLAINKATTFAIDESADQITSTITLKRPYVKKHLKRIKRASPKNLEAAIEANERAVLLDRFAHFKTSEGYNVQINRSGGFREIPGAKIMRSLKGSATSAIGLHNKLAVKYFEDALSEGKGSTPGKLAKIRKLKARAKIKPYGMTPLHSRSINQVFKSVRNEVKPSVNRFLRREFLKDLRRLTR